MNNCTFSGYLTKDPDLKYTQEGQAVVNMRIGVKANRQLRDNELEMFMDITVWGKQAESVAEYLRKGSYCIVSGDLRRRQYETDQGDRRQVDWLNAHSVEFGPRANGDAEAQGDIRPQQRRQRRGTEKAQDTERQRRSSNRSQDPLPDDYDSLPF